MVVRCANAYSREILITKGLVLNHAGSVARWDIIAVAKRDLKAGTALESNLEFSKELDSCYESHAETRQGTWLPLGMCARLRLTRDVVAGTLLTEAMVEIPRDSVLWCLRREQDAVFSAEC